MKHYFFNHNNAQLSEVNGKTFIDALNEHNNGDDISVVRWNGQTYETVTTW